MYRRVQLAPRDMTADQLECYRLWCAFKGGESHVFEAITDWSFGRARGIRIVPPGGCIGFASYDYDELTRLVVLAHDRCIRVHVAASGSRLVVTMHKRDRNAEDMALRHPTLDEHVVAIRAEVERRGPCHVYGVDP